MGLFNKFKLPAIKGSEQVKNNVKKTITGMATASVLTAGAVGATDIESPPSHKNLEPEELHTEYVEKKPTPTLTEQTEKMGINIDPKTIPADGYNAADHTITKDGIIESIQPKQRVRKTSDTIPPEELTAKFESLYSTDETPPLPLSESISQETHATGPLDGYQLDPQGTDTFVPAGGHSAQEALDTADPRDVDAVMQEETTSGIIEHGAEVPSEPITNNIDKTAETFPPEDSDTEKAPSPQSSEEINSKITTPNIPSNPEQLTELIEKAVKTLAELLKKAPNMFTKKHFALLVPVLISSLNFNNTANAASLDDVYKDLNPDSTYTNSLSPKEVLQHEASQIYIKYLKWQEQNMFKQDISSLTLSKYAEKIDLDEASYQAVLEAEESFNNTSINNISSQTMRHPADTQLADLPLVKANPNGRIVREKSSPRYAPLKKGIHLNPGINARQWNINTSGSTPNISNYDINSQGTVSGGVTKHPDSKVGISGVQID